MRMSLWSQVASALFLSVAGEQVTAVANPLQYRAELLHPAGYSSTYIRGVTGNSKVGQGSIGGGESHALLWAGPGNTVVDLHPAGFTWSVATEVAGEIQGGYGWAESDNKAHALLWHGSAASATDLTPAGFTTSTIFDLTSTHQIGSGSGSSTGNLTHALLWRGSPESVIDLHPAGLVYSQGNGVWGLSQVGVGMGDATGRQNHALLWTGTAESVIDLHPAGYASSYAGAIWDNEQVGMGFALVDHEQHALLWSGSSEKVVDLHPSGFESSYALGVGNGRQVGYGHDPTAGRFARALLWRGSAESVVDLQAYVSAMDASLMQSVASDIDEAGNIFGYASYADTGPTFAVRWTPVPEPASCLLLAAGLASLGFGRRC